MEKREKDRLLTEAMDEYGHFLVRLAYSFVKERTKAEDIVQDVFIRYYINLERFEGRSSIKTFLYRITVNECHNHFRSWSQRKITLTNKLSPFLPNGKELIKVPAFSRVEERLVKPRFTNEGKLIVNGEAADRAMYILDVETTE